MTARNTLTWAALVVVVVIAGAAPAAEPPRGAAVLIEWVTVIDVKAGVARPDQSVLIADGVIAAVGPAGCVRADGPHAVVDGRGGFLIPGLWDMHAHVADDRMLGMFLAAGVTGVRHMFSPNPLYPAARLGRGSKDGPRVVGTDTLLDGPGSALPVVLRTTAVYTAATPDEARKAVRRIKHADEDFVKVYSHLSRDAYLAAADEARKHGLPLVGHVPFAVTVEEAAAAGHKSVEHLTGVAVGCAAHRDAFEKEQRPAGGGRPVGPNDATGWRLQVRAHADHDPARAAAVYGTFAAKGTWQCPTLVQTRSLAALADPAVRYDARVALVPESVRGYWRVESAGDGVRLPALGLTLTRDDLWLRAQLLAYELRMVGTMHRAGVPLLAGTDTPNPFVLPGLSLHDELELFVKAGLTPAEALRTATSNPAAFLGRRDLGRVAAVCRADLVLLEANPLDDIRHVRGIRAVVFDGRPMARGDLLQMLGGGSQVRR